MRKETQTAFLFLLPSMVFFGAFIIGPIIFSFNLVFYDWPILQPQKFIGLNNFKNLLVDKWFWQSMGNTLYFTGCVVFGQMVLGLVIALALNTSIKGIRIFRTMYYLPVICMLVAIAQVWIIMYNPEIGITNYILGKIGVKGPDWLSNKTWAMPAVVIMTIWKEVGYPAVIYLAGLQGIPQEFYEAAELDGAGNWQKFWRVTFPILSPTTFFILIITLIRTFRAFPQIYVMTEGGPGGATTTVVYYIYETAFEHFKMGYGATVSIFFFVIILMITLIQWKISGRWVFYR